MAVPSSIPTVLGSLAVITTSALVAVHAILAHDLVNPTSPSTTTIALVAAASEGAVLVVVSTHLILHTRRIRGPPSTEKLGAQLFCRPARLGLWFGLTVAACTAGAAVSAAALASLGKSADSQSSTVLGAGVVPFLAGASATLGVCYAAQLFFAISAFIVARSPVTNSRLPPRSAYSETGSLASAYPNNSIYTRNDTASTRKTRKNRSPNASVRVKSIPYAQTSAPADSKTAEKTPPSRDSAYAEVYVHTPPKSSSGRSATDTVHSARSSLSRVIRPITSRSRLIPPNNGGMSRTSSQHSSAWRPVSLGASSISHASIEDFDSWDTSAVDPQTRLTVLERTASPAGIASRFLETIPASPTTSRCPSPGTPLDLEPPRSRRRSRSYSPAPSFGSAHGTRMRSYSQSQSPPPSSEAHIHPLFRSDSPNPPPAVSAGTVVIAAPNGGQTMASDAQSLRSFSRIRSGSLPPVPSPLSRQGSFEDFGLRRGMALAERPHTGASSGMRGEDDGAGDADRRSQADVPERKMTPPIPDWILSAGTRTSLSGYQSRKIRVHDGA